MHPSPTKARRGGLRGIGDVQQWLGTSGDAPGTSSIARRTLVICWAAAAVLVGVVNAINVISIEHDASDVGFWEPVIWEGSSWVTLMLVFWIPWVAWLAAPAGIRPRWRLVLHVPAAVLFSLLHVGGFVLVRKLIYWSLGSHYQFGEFLPQFAYEFRKDVLGYALFIGAFTLVARLLRQQQQPQMPETRTFDIRDGARLIRIRMEDILAVTAAGNYVEFVLRDGRRPLMRTPLSTLAQEFESHSFVRTHRSWLVNAAAVTGLRPEGSGDYTVEIGTFTAPLSRRFPRALQRLRG
ncbi:MAG TPA: LytTR family DNA-binding domain-containing protein [Rhizomicrobium sp.]|jgi:hypothetical protein